MKEGGAEGTGGCASPHAWFPLLLDDVACALPACGVPPLLVLLAPPAGNIISLGRGRRRGAGAGGQIGTGPPRHSRNGERVSRRTRGRAACCWVSRDDGEDALVALLEERACVKRAAALGFFHYFVRTWCVAGAGGPCTQRIWPVVDAAMLECGRRESFVEVCLWL